MRKFRTRFYTWKIALEGDRYQSQRGWYGARTSLGCRKLSEMVSVEVEWKLDWCRTYLQCNAPSSQ